MHIQNDEIAYKSTKISSSYITVVSISFASVAHIIININNISN